MDLNDDRMCRDSRSPVSSRMTDVTLGMMSRAMSRIIVLVRESSVGAASKEIWRVRFHGSINSTSRDSILVQRYERATAAQKRSIVITFYHSDMSSRQYPAQWVR